VVEEGSNEWVSGLIDVEGWPYVLQMVRADEIEDEAIKVLWTEAIKVNTYLEDILDKILRLLEEE
jgi:hypothetical protein